MGCWFSFPPSQVLHNLTKLTSIVPGVLGTTLFLPHPGANGGCSSWPGGHRGGSGHSFGICRSCATTRQGAPAGWKQHGFSTWFFIMTWIFRRGFHGLWSRSTLGDMVRSNPSVLSLPLGLDFWWFLGVRKLLHLAWGDEVTCILLYIAFSMGRGLTGVARLSRAAVENLFSISFCYRTGHGQISHRSKSKNCPNNAKATTASPHLCPYLQRLLKEEDPAGCRKAGALRPPECIACFICDIGVIFHEFSVFLSFGISMRGSCLIR